MLQNERGAERYRVCYFPWNLGDLACSDLMASWPENADHIYVYVYICVYIYMCNYMHLYIFMYIYMYICIYVYRWIHIQKYKQIDVCIHIYTKIYTHIQ